MYTFWNERCIRIDHRSVSNSKLFLKIIKIKKNVRIYENSFKYSTADYHFFRKLSKLSCSIFIFQSLLYWFVKSKSGIENWTKILKLNVLQSHLMSYWWLGLYFSQIWRKCRQFKLILFWIFLATVLSHSAFQSTFVSSLLGNSKIQ